MVSSPLTMVYPADAACWCLSPWQAIDVYPDCGVRAGRCDRLPALVWTQKSSDIQLWVVAPAGRGIAPRLARVGGVTVLSATTWCSRSAPRGPFTRWVSPYRPRDR